MLLKLNSADRLIASMSALLASWMLITASAAPIISI